jgi:selenocysteine lyase/cysteine desulfurase
LLPPAPGFEDGTVNYLSLPAVEIGLRHIGAIGVETIHERVICLTGWLLDAMLALRHDNGTPLVRIYGPTDLDQRGGTIAFNFFDRHGKAHDFRRVEALAAQANISLRTGCFCNPGAGEVAHNVTKAEMAHCFNGPEPLSFDQFFALIQRLGDGKTPSTVRISVGLATNFADVYRFVQFARGFLDRTVEDIEALSRIHEHGRSIRDAG